ncbi:MAG TPA: M56 family metallopeptidase [Tepidisphaeraceae bacterium]|nr:M56 family metallopeptidase [Tepidisphaeraceae bacterium]
MNEFASLAPFVETLVPRLGWTLVHSLWQGVVFAALLAAVLRLMRAAPPSARYAASCAALGLMVLAAAASFAVIAVKAPAPARVAEAMASAAVAPVSPAAYVGVAKVADMLPAPPLSRSVVAGTTAAQLRTLRYLVAAWLVGVAVMAAWHAAGWLLLRRLARGPRAGRYDDLLARLLRELGISRDVRLIDCPRIDVPAVVGALRPVILVPLAVLNHLTPQQVQAILAHELAHVRRHDYLVNLFQAAVETLMFYHPAAWWMSATIRQERENCCDDIAARACGDARGYAAALAALEGRRGASRRLTTSLATAATGGDLLARVRRVLKLPDRRRPGRVRSLAAAVLALTCVAAPIWLLAQETKPSGEGPASHSRATANATTTTVATDPVEPTSPIEPADLAVAAEDYRIGPSDLVNVSIAELTAAGVETVKAARVSETGSISLPFLEQVKVAGLTEAAAAKLIARAYEEARVLAKAQVAVTVAEARGRTFSILGQVDRPGQYAVPKNDFRMLDVLAMSGGRPGDIGTLRVIRASAKPAGDGAGAGGGGGATGNDKKRVIDVPLDRLIAGDSGVNLVVRPGDMLIASPRQREFVRVIIGKDSLLYEGRPIDVARLRQVLSELPDARRKNTVLEVAAAAPDVTVDRFFSTSALLSDLARQHGLAYVSQTGIHPTAAADAPIGAAPPATGTATAPTGFIPDAALVRIAQLDPTMRRYVEERDESAARSANLARSHGLGSRTYIESIRALEAHQRKVQDHAKAYLAGLRPEARAQLALPPHEAAPASGDEYYITGVVPRAGAFSLPAGRALNVKQAIAAAGGVQADERHTTVTVIRREGDRESKVMEQVGVEDLFLGKQKDVTLRAGDIVQVHPPRTGEYYMDGHVRRAGAYSLTSRRITLAQALAAAGGLEENRKDALVSILRREGGNQRYLLANALYSDIVVGKHAEVFLDIGDIIRVGDRRIEPASEPATAPAAAPATAP